MKLLASLCIVAALSTASAFEKKNSSSSQEPPFDADLFHRDEQVISLHGDFLFWRVQEGALDYAIAMKDTAWGPSQCYAQGNFKSATFNGDPGFRFAGSFFRAPKYWEFWVQYTRLTAHGKDSSHKPAAADEFLNGTWPQIFTNPVASAKSSIHFNYNVADLLADRVFFPNPHLRLRFIGGGTAAWINQFWKIKYQDSSNIETKIGNRWKFFGGGLRVGAFLDWYWFTDIYITGGTSVAALVGSYKNSSFQSTNFQEGGFNSALPLRDAHFRDIRPTLNGQFFFGPSYQKNVGCHRIELFAGYELGVWLNLQEIYRSTSGSPSAAKETWINSSMVALQGLTTRLTVDF